MTYNYVCPTCSMEITISKPIEQSDRIEHCQICETKLKRVYEVPMIKTADGVNR